MAAQQPRGLRLSYARLHSARATVGITPRPGALPSLYSPWTEAEVQSHLATGWGEGAITELKLEYLYGPEPEVSGE
jgi:hypothetical protein